MGRLAPLLIFPSYICIAQTLFYVLQTVLILIQGFTYNISRAAVEICFCSFCEVNLHIHVAFFHCENHLSMAHSIYLNSLSVMKRKTDVFTVLSFHSFWLVRSLARLYSWILYISVASLSPCLFLSHTHIFSCDSFFQFSLVLLLPSPSLPFFSPFFFPSLSFSLSPAPLLSPSERLRIPKGADAIKMLILSVYRERERGGGLTA